jgi:hypothetical protein
MILLLLTLLYISAYSVDQWIAYNELKQRRKARRSKVQPRLK